MIDHIDYLPFFLSLSSLFFCNAFAKVANPNLVIDYLSFALSLFSLLLPLENFNELCFNIDEEKYMNTTYEENILNFISDYDRTNPITRDIAL